MNPKGVESRPGVPDPALSVALTAEKVAAWRTRMEQKATEIAREEHFSRHRVNEPTNVDTMR